MQPGDGESPARGSARDRSAAPVIDVRGASVRYGPVRALREATAAVGSGRVCGLVGMNGSGKSTLMKVMLGLVRPDPGQVLINGAPPSSARSEERRVGKGGRGGGGEGAWKVRVMRGVGVR